MNRLLLLLLFLPAMAVIAIGYASDADPVIPPAAFGDQCVADTDVMRKDHMKLLNHQRDDTVIDGIRGEPFSLVGCVNCHAQRNDSGQAIRIDAEGQFCQSCHAFAAVKIDCFTCHAALPEDGKLIGYKLHQHLQVADTRIHSARQLHVMHTQRAAGEEL